MRKNISLVILLIVSICLLLIGCENEKTDIAFITSLDTKDSGSAAANCLDGIESYADANGLSYKVYGGDSAEQLAAAQADGVQTVVLFAVDDEFAVYECAGKYTDTKFICIDFGNDFAVRPNIYCVNTSKTNNGIYAGYSAVKEGYRCVGIQGEETAETYNYIRGFVGGAQTAAVETGVSRKPIQIWYNVSGSDMASERSESWYENGCTLIFCSDESYSEVYKNISNSDLYSVMTFGADREREDERIIASVYSEYGNIVSDALSDVYNGQFKGGIMYCADAASGFSFDKNRFSVFSQSDLATVGSMISESDISDSTVFKTPSDKGYSKIKLNEKGIITDSEQDK